MVWVLFATIKLYTTAQSAVRDERPFGSTCSTTYDELNNHMKYPHITVIGAGIIGLTSAYLLAKRGHKVTLLDSHPEPARETSYANGAQLSYTFADAMSSPALLKKLPGILFGQDPAFQVNTLFSLPLAHWGVRFLMNGLKSFEQRNTQHLLRLAGLSQHAMSQLLEQEQIAFDHRCSGKLQIFTSQSSFKSAATRVLDKQQWGCSQALLSAEECIALEPTLSQLPMPLYGGTYAESDEVGDPVKFANTLMEQLRSNANVDILMPCQALNFVAKQGRVWSINTSIGPIQSDAFVLATGPRSFPLLKPFTPLLPIYPVKGYSVTVPATVNAPNICITDVSNKVVIAKLGDRLRIAGCADIDGFDWKINPARIQHLLNIGRTLLPKAGDYKGDVEKWCGLRPVTPSSLPIIGNALMDNLYLNIGHGMLGWTLAMGSASLLSSMLNDEAPAIPPTGLLPAAHGIR